MISIIYSQPTIYQHLIYNDKTLYKKPLKWNESLLQNKTDKQRYSINKYDIDYCKKKKKKHMLSVFVRIASQRRFQQIHHMFHRVKRKKKHSCFHLPYCSVLGFFIFCNFFFNGNILGNNYCHYNEGPLYKENKKWPKTVPSGTPDKTVALKHCQLVFATQTHKQSILRRVFPHIPSLCRLHLKSSFLSYCKTFNFGGSKFSRFLWVDLFAEFYFRGFLVSKKKNNKKKKRDFRLCPVCLMHASSTRWFACYTRW